MPHQSSRTLDDLGFKIFPPGEALRPYIRSYWIFRRETPLLTLHEEFMHPRAGYGIVFNFGDQLLLDGKPLPADVFLDGSNSISRKMGFRGRIELMGVRFYEGGSYPFLNIPLAELRDETHLLDVLRRSELLQVHRQLQELNSTSERMELLEAWLLKRIAAGAERDPLIPASLIELQRAQGLHPIPQLAEQFAISQRQLERLFQKQVGVTPKKYAQLFRVEQARLNLRRISPNTSPNLALLAAELGFYDQSHFIRQFRSVIGMTPYRYLKRGWERVQSNDAQ